MIQYEIFDAVSRSINMMENRPVVNGDCNIDAARKYLDDRIGVGNYTIKRSADEKSVNFKVAPRDYRDGVKYLCHNRRVSWYIVEFKK